MLPKKNGHTLAPQVSTAISIRKMKPEDRRSWAKMRRQLWPECPAARHALEMEQLLSGDGVILLAEDSSGGPVGFAEVSIRRDHVEGTEEAPVPYLEGWYVIPSKRRQGVGRALMEGVEEWALQAGYLELASDAETNNAASIQVHLELGFREVGRSVHFVRKLKPPRPKSPRRRP